MVGSPAGGYQEASAERQAEVGRAEAGARPQSLQMFISAASSATATPFERGIVAGYAAGMTQVWERPHLLGRQHTRVACPTSLDEGVAVLCLFAQRHTTQRADPRDADNRNKGEGGDVKTPKAPPPLDPRVGSLATIVMQTACLPASLAHPPSPDGVMLHGRRRTTRRSQSSSRWVHSRPARGDARRRGSEWLEGCATRRCFWLAPRGATVASSPASRGVENFPFPAHLVPILVVELGLIHDILIHIHS